MPLLRLILLSAAAAPAQDEVLPPGVSAELECEMRKAAFRFFQQIQPWQAAQAARHVFDALKLPTMCHCRFPATQPGERRRPQPPAAAAVGWCVHVDALHGRDRGNDGSIGQPLATVQAALQLSRGAGLSTQPRTIFLHGGQHYLASTVVLDGARDSLLSIVAHPEKKMPAVLSGGVKLITDGWRPSASHSRSRLPVFETTVLTALPSGAMPALRLNGRRMVPARYPNLLAPLETNRAPDGWLPSNASMWLKPHQFNASRSVIVKGLRSDGSMFRDFGLGIGGSCAHFSPPSSYWCASNAAGGGPHGYVFPSGVVINRTSHNRNWTTQALKGARLHTFRPGHWSTWQFEIDSAGVVENGRTQLTFGRGGFQGARGAPTGDELFVENIYSELDALDEYYFDARSRKLFVIPNSTLSDSDELIVPKLEQLIHVNASQGKPLRNFSLVGVTLTETAPTFLSPHGVPSGGDWALERIGALHLEGTVSARIDACNFSRCDGNGIMISGYHRGLRITGSNFEWLGASAMASWGRTHFEDATAGNVPIGTTVVGNICREIGLWEKQSSCWFQAKTGSTLLHSNVFYNGPRAAINVNDGLMGGTEVAECLLFNQCRESGDHAVFNSWDRQPFVYQGPDGKKLVTPEYNSVHHNFLLCNYNSAMCIDNDDGSAYYQNHHNVQIYGGHKTSYGGHSKHSTENLMLFARAQPASVVCTNRHCEITKCCHWGLCGGFALAGAYIDESHADHFEGNVCVQGVETAYPAYIMESSGCPETNNVGVLPVLSRNRVHNRFNFTGAVCGKLPRAPQQQPTLACEPNVNLDGGDVHPSLPTRQRDAVACSAACKSESKCRAYVFERCGGLGASGLCWLKQGGWKSKRFNGTCSRRCNITAVGGCSMCSQIFIEPSLVGGELVDVASWRSSGFDRGSTTLPLPNTAQIIAWIEEMLSIPQRGSMQCLAL